MSTWQVGEVRVTAVHEPGFELLVPQDDATTAKMRAHDWLAPYLTEDGVLRVSTAAIVVEHDDRILVVDPWLAFDAPDRRDPEFRERAKRRLDAFAAAGFDTAEVDAVVNTHIDGLGSNTTPTGGEREATTFANATYLFPAAQLAALAAGERPGAEPIQSIDALVPVDPGDDEFVVGDEVTLLSTPGHSPGHITVRVASGGDAAYVVGHMFLHPAQLLDPDAGLLDEDPVTNARTRRTVLDRAVEEHALLIGPLFAPPGGGRVERDGPGYRLVAP
jgi:glyoxylase-like metal-dependent hydrolase (beta-lactamase superfamily II)